MNTYKANSDPYRVSASQVAAFKLCPRKWAWQYIAGLKPAQKESTALGSRVHEILAEYLEKGTPPNTQETWTFTDDAPVKYPGKIALQMIGPMLPQPKTASVEQQMYFCLDDIFYTSILDCYKFDRTGVGETLVIIDHKTSSDPQKWGKTADSLRADPQALLYAMCGLNMFRGSKNIDLVKCIWNYGSAKAIASAAYTAQFAATPEAIEKLYREHVEPFARLIQQHKQAQTDPLALPFNANACSVYGGCDHMARCALTSKERIGAIIMGDSLIDDLINQAAQSNQETRAANDPDDAVNPPEAHEDVDIEPATGGAVEVAPLEVNELPVKEQPKRVRAKKARPAVEAETEPVVPTTSAIRQSVSAGAFDEQIDEIIDTIAERALKRLVSRLRGSLSE